MNITLDTRTGTGVRPTSPALWPVLALAETRRLLTHPAVLTALVAVLMLWLVPLTANTASLEFSYLTAASVDVQQPLLLLAGGTFAGANMIAMYPYRFGTLEFESVLSLPQWQRVSALSVATVGPALAGLLVASAQLLVQVVAPGAAGRVRVGEVLAIPAVIILSGLLGILVAEATRNTAAGFVLLVVFGIVAFVGIASESPTRWLAFVAGHNPFIEPPMPAELIDRPEWWHLLWLAGLAAVVAGATLWLTSRSPLLLTITAALVTVPVLAAVMQLRQASPDLERRLAQAQQAPSARQECVVRGKVTYCAFPEFSSRIDSWAEIVDGQLAVVPPGSAPAKLHVRQHLPIATGDQGMGMPLPLDAWAADDAAAGTPNAIPVSTRWSAGGVDSYDETEVIGFSAWLAGVLTTGAPLAADGNEICGGRGAVALWLAASATPDTRQALATVDSHTSGGLGVVSLTSLNSMAGVRFGESETALAGALLQGDPAEVRAAVTEHWIKLTDPKTDVQRAAELLGLRAQGFPSAESAVCS